MTKIKKIKKLTISQVLKELEKGNVFEVRPHVFQKFSSGRIAFITKGGEKELIQLIKNKEIKLKEEIRRRKNYGN